MSMIVKHVYSSSTDAAHDPRQQRPSTILSTLTSKLARLERALFVQIYGHAQLASLFAGI